MPAQRQLRESWEGGSDDSHVSLHLLDHRIQPAAQHLLGKKYTSMNTLVFADIAEKDASSASSIASTAQQMSISFGVAVAGLATAFFVPSTHSNPAEMIHGIHKALLSLGIFTVLSTMVFRTLRSGDGDDVSLHKVLHPGG
jgi:hypothetical protein